MMATPTCWESQCSGLGPQTTDLTQRLTLALQSCQAKQICSLSGRSSPEVPAEGAGEILVPAWRQSWMA